MTQLSTGQETGAYQALEALTWPQEIEAWRYFASQKHR